MVVVIPRRNLAAVAAMLSLSTTVLIAGCTATPAASTAPSPSSPASASAEPTASLSAAAPTSAASSTAASAGSSAATGQTAVDWGVIWDTLPPGFPTYPGAQPTVTGGGPASGVFDIPVAPETAMAWYEAALAAAGFTVVGANGPREDGSYLIDAQSASAAGCATQVNLAPLGSTTTATVYLGAACPLL